jgi:predicted ATPase
MLWQGKRNALPRHQTLKAMHDWSFNLLSERDREVLASLSVFVGLFTLPAVRCVVGQSESDAPEIDRAVASLADKSLIAASVVNGVTHFRLLNTTREYARMKLDESGTLDRVALNHARYYSGLSDKALSSVGSDSARLSPHLSNTNATPD